MLKKSAQYANSPALREFQLASREYTEACRVFTPIRIAASHSRSTDEEIIRLHRARPVYKLACQKYHEARAKFVSAMREIKTPVYQISNRDLDSMTVEANERVIGQELRKEAALKELGGQEAVDAIMAEVIARRKAREEGFDLEKYENATKPLMGDKPFKLDDESAADPLDLDSDPFGDNTLKARGVK
jgi:hypothetical protein